MGRLELIQILRRWLWHDNGSVFSCYGMSRILISEGRITVKTKNDAIILFLVGLFSYTQIRLGAKIGVSELFMCVVAPFVFMRRFSDFRREGIMPLIVLSLLWLFGGIISDLINKVPLFFSIKGIAVPYVTFATLVCLYALLRNNISNFKWLILGFAMSTVLSVFVLQRGVAGDFAAEGHSDMAIERVIGYKLFWTSMAQEWFTLPIRGWYLNMPMIYSVCVLLGISTFQLYSGGRAQFASTFFSAIIVCVGKKSAKSMLGVKRHFLIFLILMIMAGMAAKYTYKYAVTHGWLGNVEQNKFEGQTKKGSGVLQMLMAGRVETFVGFMAALDNPILGQGSFAVDSNGYYGKFVSEYGDQDEIQRYVKNAMFMDAAFIPAHSHIILYWVWHGVCGLVFWLYVLWLMIVVFARKMHVCPELFGYLAVSLPLAFWDLFFSPFGQRVPDLAIYLLCAMVVNISKRKLPNGFVGDVPCHYYQ